MFFFQLFDPFSFLKKEFYHHLLPDRLAPSSLPVTNACFFTISFSSKKSRINENHIFFQFRKLLLRKKKREKKETHNKTNLISSAFNHHIALCSPRTSSIVLNGTVSPAVRITIPSYDLLLYETKDGNGEAIESRSAVNFVANK